MRYALIGGVWIVAMFVVGWTLIRVGARKEREQEDAAGVTADRHQVKATSDADGAANQQN